MTSDKLLVVLDINGVLIERIHRTNMHTFPSVKSSQNFITPNGYFVFVRPNIKPFFDFLFDTYDVAIWSSMNPTNTHTIINKLFTKSQRDLIKFVFTQENCKVENNIGDIKPTFYKIFNYTIPELYSYYNKTILIDDSPIKCLYNKKFTSIHPKTFNHKKFDDELLFLIKYLQSILHMVEYTNDYCIPKYIETYKYSDLRENKDNTYLLPVVKSRKRKINNLKIDDKNNNSKKLHKTNDNEITHKEKYRYVKKITMNIYNYVYILFKKSWLWLFGSRV